MIEMTDAARARVKELLNDETGNRLRVFVQSGGCSGFEYGMAFDEVREGDEVVEMDGFSLLVDQDSARALSGVKVDFVESLTGSGFTFMNPNARSSCGCGHSFSA
ncbi:MAG: iron-sulfur cluster assembly accessory protein [Planctomycetes bacterium]|jgi:iron-sulfur cluster assembly accessory protein|nr:iron-sulfur cluster assembly accessory protein [Planctomycetota bacterium]